MLRPVTLCIMMLSLAACASRNELNAPIQASALSSLPALRSPPDAETADALVRYIAAVSQLNHKQRDALRTNNLKRYRSDPSALRALTLAISLSAPPTNGAALDIDPADFAVDPPLPASLQVVARRAAGWRERVSDLETAARDDRALLESLEQTLASERSAAAQDIKKLDAQLSAALAKINALTTIEEEIRRTEPTDEDSP